MAEPLRIVIVGGGICGLATAVALRAPGRKIIILEQSRMNREVGALISLQPNASKIATKLGLDKFLANKRPTIDTAFQIYNSDGNIVNTIKFDTSSPAGNRICYHRVDLHESLQEAAVAEDGQSPPAEIRVSSRVVACDPEAGLVTLENGTTVAGDLIIGADGIHSVLRQYVLSDSEDKSLHQPKPTGVSAYRLLLPTERIVSSLPDIKTYLDPAAPMTHMIIGHNQRVVMGPARQGTIFGITALVPDENMHESTSESRSWTSAGSTSKLLETFSEFPQWLKDIFTLASSPEDSTRPSESEDNSELALWQLRDIDPLPRWSHGRLILVGDAAHAMLPTQGQGASQSFEDAEALGEFLSDIHNSSTPSPSSIPSKTQLVQLAHRYFACRYDRASLIQRYSREQGMKPGAQGQGAEKKVLLNPAEFMKYNTSYDGARDWEERQKKEVAQKKEEEESKRLDASATKEISVAS